MYNIGMWKGVDDLGRLCIPKEVAYSVGIESNDLVNISIDRDTKKIVIQAISNKVREVIKAYNDLDELEKEMFKNNIDNF